MPGFTVTGERVGVQTAELAADVREGLSARPKHLPCRWFYDSEGSRLFEEICGLPEYYLSRCGKAILADHRREIVASLPTGGSLLELGSGSSEKTRILIEELLRRDGALRYVAIDISRPALEEAGRMLASRYAGLEFRGIVAEYHEGLGKLAEARLGEPRMVLWLGSSIGNFDRPAARRFLRNLRDHFAPADVLLIGIDLRKDPRVLLAAYDDARGVTARFNLNLLARINRELGGEFRLDTFRHVASYDDGPGRIQMHLVSTRAQRVAIRDLGMSVDFHEGESIHTEDSYKYSIEEIRDLAASSGFRVSRQWLDPEGRFSMSLFATG